LAQDHIILWLEERYRIITKALTLQQIITGQVTLLLLIPSIDPHIENIKADGDKWSFTKHSTIVATNEL
jgi:hypothetical protein